MSQSLYHPGPDDEGVFLDGNTGLGGRRLRVIDIEGEHKSLSNEDRSVWMIHNEEDYNFHEFHKELRYL